MRGGVLMAILPHSLSRWPLDFLSAIITLLILANGAVLFLDFPPSFGRVGMVTYLRYCHNISHKSYCISFTYCKITLFGFNNPF